MYLATKTTTATSSIYIFLRSKESMDTGTLIVGQMFVQ